MIEINTNNAIRLPNDFGKHTTFYWKLSWKERFIILFTGCFKITINSSFYWQLTWKERFMILYTGRFKITINSLIK